MTDTERVVAESPADFSSAFAYALHPEMRRLLIVTIVGSILLPIGLAMFFDPSQTVGLGFVETLLRRVIGLALAIAGAAAFYGGIVAILFKTIIDANTVATRQ